MEHQLLLDVLDEAAKDWRLAVQIDRWMDGVFKQPYTPQHGADEYRSLANRCVANMLPLVVDLISQSLFVEGYKTVGDASWGFWQAERLDSRQSSIHRAAFTFGQALVAVLPDKQGRWRVRGLPPQRAFALWDDPAGDEWPEVVVWRKPLKNGDDEVTWVDDTNVSVWRGSARKYRLVSRFEHGVGVCPVVRFADHVTLEGATPSQIVKLVPSQERLNQTVFDLLMTQTFSSFKVKTLTGMMPPEDAEGDAEMQAEHIAAMERTKLKIAQDRILIASDPEAKFGELSETNLAGFIGAVELSIRQIATLAQTPPHSLIGSMSNLSAEALAAAESGLNRKVVEIQHAYGESWEQVLRLLALVNGVKPEAEDMASQVMWRDTSARSLSQAVDAWGKAAAMLKIAPEVLWRKIPGITEADIEEAKELLADDPLLRMVGELDGAKMDMSDVPPADVEATG